MNKQTSNQQDEKPIKAVGMVNLIKKGYTFEFTVEDSTVVAWGSTMTGKEIVYVDGQQVSQSRNLLSRKSSHKFELSGHEYEIEFNMTSIMRGELHCIMIKDGVHFQTKKMCPTNLTNNKSMSLTRSFIEGLCFGLIGYGIGYYIVHHLDDDGTVTSLLLDSINIFLV